MSLICDFCGLEKPKMTTWENSRTKEKLNLCFRGCQNFPEPFRDTEAGIDRNNWSRIDPYQNYKRPQPKLRGKRQRKLK